MSLLEFCRTPRHLVARERLLHTRAVYEMKLGAAIEQEQILMTEPEIDNEGYDFTITSAYYHLHIQNKAALDRSGAKAWEIHAALLRPSFHDRDLVPLFDGLPLWAPIGASGGVLLHVISTEAADRNALEVAYFYFDVFYALAVAEGIWNSSAFSAEQAHTLLGKIQEADTNGRIILPKHAFFPITSPAAILALRMGVGGPSNYISALQMGAKSTDSVSRTLAARLWGQSVAPWAA
jgi:hypothetical protein